MTYRLRLTDKMLLSDAIKSNGGGVDEGRYADATVKRLLKNGFVQWRPNQSKSRHYSLLLTLTELGKTAVQNRT